MHHPEAIINQKNLIYNINYIKNIVGNNVNIMPVVKANAYGHGVIQICKILLFLRFVNKINFFYVLHR